MTSKPNSKETLYNVLTNFINDCQNNQYTNKLAFIILADNYGNVNDNIKISRLNKNDTLQLLLQFKNINESDSIIQTKEMLNNLSLSDFYNINCNQGIVNVSFSLKFKNTSKTSTKSQIKNQLTIKDIKERSKIFSDKAKGQTALGHSTTRVSCINSNGQIVSAAAQVKEILDTIVKNNSMTREAIDILTDVYKCKEYMSLSYPLLFRVNPHLTYSEQAKFNGKTRYSKTIVNFFGIDYYVTNHIFKNHIEKIQAYLKSINLLSK